jgi:hypothetical protein
MALKYTGLFLDLKLNSSLCSALYIKYIKCLEYPLVSTSEMLRLLLTIGLYLQHISAIHCFNGIFPLEKNSSKRFKCRQLWNKNFT